MLFGEETFENAADLFGREPELLGAVDRGRQKLGKLFFAIGEPAGDRWDADPHALTTHPLDETFQLEPRVRFADGHGVDLSGLSDLSDAGQDVARPQFSTGDQRADLVDKLPVDRDAGRRVKLE